jgi:nucleoside-diphosphate-sugar epimerase
LSRRPIFVTGATGYLGRHFIASPARRRRPLLCLARTPPSEPASGVEWVQGDVTSDGAWQRRVRGCDAVVHLATVPLAECESDPAAGERVIVGGLRRLLDAASQSPVRRWVVASTLEVYGISARLPIDERAALAPASTYGYLKACADLYAGLRAREQGLSLCILRFSNLYGSDPQLDSPETVLNVFARRILAGETVVLHRSYRNSRDFLHVRDAARALWLALDRPAAEGVLTIGSGAETRLKDAATLLARIARRELRIELRPDDGRVRRARAGLVRARAALGFAPAVPLERGLREVVRAVAKDLRGCER